MIKSLVATTYEIDDINAAVDEILTKLDIEKNLLANSIGIISCFSEFDDTGVIKAICDALPFDCIGATTCVCASGGTVDQMLLSITVLTSDDCSFKSITAPMAGDYKQSIADSLAASLKQNGESPKLILSYLPLMNEVSGDMIITEIDKATGAIPLFGTAAVDHMMDYSTSKTICNGEAFRDMLVLGAIYGEPKFSFEIASLDESKIRKQKAIITESNGNILIGVNGKTALEYLQEIGLTKEELATGMGVVPLVVDHNDGTKPISRAVFALTPDGHAICGGAMPVNATLSIGQVDMNDVLNTTEAMLKSFVNDDDSVILSYSCMARYLILGANNTAEAQKIVDISGERNYQFACSGGEVCPLIDANGSYRNFYHNYTIVFCRLS